MAVSSPCDLVLRVSSCRGHGRWRYVEVDIASAGTSYVAIVIECGAGHVVYTVGAAHGQRGRAGSHAGSGGGGADTSLLADGLTLWKRS